MSEQLQKIESAVGEECTSLLKHQCHGIKKEQLELPGPDFLERVWVASDRSPQVLKSLQSLYNTGRLAGTGYLSILPVDQGIEHSAGASFAKNPIYFDPEEIVKLGIEGGCNGVATTYGALGIVARRYAHRIPLILKINHNELLTYPNKFDQIMFARVKEAWNMGCTAIGATIYFGSPESSRQIQEVSLAFAQAHELGMATILWCYLRNSGFAIGGVNYETSADLSSQANHIGATIEADILKQKLPEVNGGFKALNTGNSSYGKLDERMYTDLSTPHPIDLARYQVANGFMGRIGLINSGGGSGKNDMKEALKTAIINKRAGGMGLISGRKAFQKPMKEGVSLLNAIQDVYLCKDITVA
jgi:class I fructose-bisphosphate aldolase